MAKQLRVPSQETIQNHIQAMRDSGQDPRLIKEAEDVLRELYPEGETLIE